MPSFKENKKKSTPTSFRLSKNVQSMLKYISEKDGRSSTKEIECLIRQRYVAMKDIENTGGIII